MDKNRLEAFSDGVLAIIITIMILDLKIPLNPTWQSYVDVYPTFASYVLSFILVGLYWSTHHHLFHTAHKVDNKVLWMNMFTLFWQSLIPFATASMGANHFSSITVTIYAGILVFGTIAHTFLVKSLIRLHGENSAVAKVSKKDWIKGYFTLGMNISSTIIAYIGYPRIAFTFIASAALLWFLPSKVSDNLLPEKLS